MFDRNASTSPPGGVVERLTALIGELGSLPDAGGDTERIDRIAVLDRLKATVAAAQVAETAAFAESQVAQQKAQGVPPERLGRGVAEQVALAERVSPATAARRVDTATILAENLTRTFELLAQGRVSEWVARIVADETKILDGEARGLVDRELAGELPELSPAAARVAARRLVLQSDPRAAGKRARAARADRRVSVRPAPDTMAVLNIYAPAEQGIAAWAALRKHAENVHCVDGDPRGVGQIMSDTAIERLTGRAAAAGAQVEIGLIMTDRALFAGSDTPAQLREYGPIPASTALDIIGRAANEPAGRVRTFLRRLFTDPVDGTIAHIDTRRRRFDGALAKLLIYRDQHCADPYCTAPIRHLDHIVAYSHGGPTDASHGRGVCERGNYVKEMLGWHARIIQAPDGTRIVETTTPTGHSYRASPSPALGHGSRKDLTADSPAERYAQRTYIKWHASSGGARDTNRPPPKRPPP